MKRLKSICKYPGCNNLVNKPGYCEKHSYIEDERKKNRWKEADAKKTPKQKAFYNSHLWHRTSVKHRRKEPLCRQCKKEGRITIGTQVHHEPALEELDAQGLNPYLDNYLVTLCTKCHNKLHKGSK